MTLLFLVLTPTLSAGASDSDFQMTGNTLVSYTGTASTVSVPANVEIIGRSAFENNSKIKKVIIPDSVKAIEQYAFWGCANLEKVTLGKGISEIADFTFTACDKLKKVHIPDTVQRIGVMAFADCESLKNITLPISVMDIHDTAFDGVTDLTIHAVEHSYPYRYALERGQNTTNAPEPTEEPVVVATPAPTPVPTPEPTNRPIGEVMGSATIVGNQAVIFMDGEEMNTAEGKDIDVNKLFPPITRIEDWEHYGNKALKEIKLPKGTVSIGRFGFARSGLKKIDIPEGTTTIKYAAFYHCDDLAEVNIPKTVCEIEAKAFAFTAWMVDFMSGKNKENGDFLIVGDGILLAYRGNTEKVSIPYGVKVIAEEAFLNHKEIKEVEYPPTIVKIDDTAFQGCDYKPAE